MTTTQTAAATPNTLIARTTWARLVNLSFELTNQFPDGEAQPSRVYLSDCSGQVHREIERELGASKPHYVSGDFGGWNGYEEAGVIRILWESCSSGATLTATRDGSGWQLTFVGTTREEYVENKKESYYVVWFAQTALPETIECENYDDNLIQYLDELSDQGGRDAAEILLKILQ